MAVLGKRRTITTAPMWTLLVVFAAAPTLIGCDNDAEIQEIKKQSEVKDAEIRTLKDDLVQRSQRIGFLEGQIEAKLVNFDTALKDGLAACQAQQTDTALSEQLARIEKSCTKLRDGIQSAVNCSATPLPAGCPVPTSPPAVNCLADPRPAGCPSLPDSVPAPVPDDPPDCTRFPNLAGCRPLRPDDPPPEGSGVEDGDAMNKTVLLAAAYIACTYYTAGACAIAVSLVAGKLGMGESDVRGSMKSSFETLGEAVNNGVEIPGPDGKPVVLTVRTATELFDAKKRYDALTVDERNNPCKVIGVFRTVNAVDQYLNSLLDPLQFPSQKHKDSVIKVAREVDLQLAKVLAGVPVKPEAIRCGS